ncbi:MAG: hypothetical protein IT480_07405 [Gammaproteobacteria bacterium]|nr:hypothetical protein [Gammaproteobacteria bacterium]
MPRSTLIALAALLHFDAAPAQEPPSAAAPAPAEVPASYGKPKKGGSIGNSYASQMVPINASSLRITTRKRISGSMEEINKPGTSAYKALQAVADAATLRAAVETRYLGYGAFRVLGFRNLSTSQQPHQSARNAMGEDSFTFAPGKYDENIELAIELTIELMPATPQGARVGDVYEAAPILQANGIGG